MKKLISLALLVVMLFSLTSCSFLLAGFEKNTDTSSNTASITQTNTQTSTNTGSTTNSNTNTNTYVPPILDHDTIKYEVKYSKDGKKIYYAGSYSFKVPTFTDYYNDYQGALSMTFDDGADIAAAELAHEIMSEYGLKGTLMVNTGNLDNSGLSRWQALVALGTLDIGSHGWAHLDPNSTSVEQMDHEIKDSYDFLQTNFPNENPVTYATPLSHLTEAYKQYLIDTGFIANRLEVGGKMVSPDTENPDFYTLYAKRIDKGNPEMNVRINVGDALSAGKWFIELYHNVRDRDSTDITEEDFRAHCQWLYDNYNGKVWFASYDDVAKYMVQKQNATIEYTACDSESMTFVAKVDKSYGQEMTAKFYMPFFIDSAYAIIDGEETLLEIKKENNARSALINFTPSEAGTEIKIVMGGNDKYFNNCQHNYVEHNVVAPTETSFGYTEMICTVPECQHIYKEKFTK